MKQSIRHSHHSNAYEKGVSSLNDHPKYFGNIPDFYVKKEQASLLSEQTLV